MAERLLLFQWGVSSYFGWGVYGLNLLLALAARDDLQAASMQPINPAQLDIDPLERKLIAPALQRSAQLHEQLRRLAGQRVSSRHTVLHTLNNGMQPGRAAFDCDVRSADQVAVAFLERTEWDSDAAVRLREYGFIVAGSSWNRNLLLEAGAARVECLLQGVDISHFHPAPRRGLFPGRFVVFSGGKLEYRKGQDLVMQAFARFAERHPEALLLTAWSSPWPDGARSLAIDEGAVPPPFRADGTVDVTGWAALHGVAGTQVIDLGAAGNRSMPRIMREADVALFASRAEGGTNLVAMECMACGVPTILSANTGHLDLIGDERCIALSEQTPIAGAGFRGWGRSQVDEIVACLEAAYADPDASRQRGLRAASCMADLTWTQQMGKLAQMLTNGFSRPSLERVQGRALLLSPADEDNNLGAGFAMQGRLDEAAACLRSALAGKPDLAQAHNNLAMVLKEQGRLDEAVISYRQAIALKPDFAEAHYNLAWVLLKQGDMTAGWAAYEWRWKTPTLSKQRRHFSQPQWQGEEARGRTLLVHSEQGLGDSLHFCRYATLAAARGMRVIIEAPKSLARLLRSLPLVDRVVERAEDLPPFDYHCPMLSLPWAFCTTLETIPRTDAYLHADLAKAAAWRTRLSRLPGQGLRVGLVWAGNPAPNADHRRSLPPDLLSPLFALSGLQFFSLQKDGPAPPIAFPITDFMTEMEEFADTAALVANLDLIISVDTAVAHLAAALGKPVWLLAQFDPCWRWLVGRNDSPWYPTMRLYRQPVPGAWDMLLTEVVRDLLLSKDGASCEARIRVTPQAPPKTCLWKPLLKQAGFA